jgi:hypothetical protein
MFEDYINLVYDVCLIGIIYVHFQEPAASKFKLMQEN